MIVAEDKYRFHDSILCKNQKLYYLDQFSGTLSVGQEMTILSLSSRKTMFGEFRVTEVEESCVIVISFAAFIPTSFLLRKDFFS
jgi:hypothetical protein